MPQSWDMGQILLLPLRRKACWGFLRPKNPTASAGFEPANLLRGKFVINFHHLCVTFFFFKFWGKTFTDWRCFITGWQNKSESNRKKEKGHNARCHNLYFSLTRWSITKILARNLARMERWDMHTNFCGNIWREGVFGRQRRTWQDNIKTDRKQIGL